MDQFHETFTTFSGPSIESVGDQAVQFVRAKKASAKSIAIVLTKTGGYVLSLGYIDNQDYYPVDVVSETKHLPWAEDIDGFVQKTASALPGNVLCHSLLVEDSGAVTVTFLTHAG